MKNKKAIILAVFAAAVFLLTFLVNRNVTMYGDDYLYRRFVMGTFADFLANHAEHYFLANGRVIVTASASNITSRGTVSLTPSYGSTLRLYVRDAVSGELVTPNVQWVVAWSDDAPFLTPIAGICAPERLIVSGATSLKYDISIERVHGANVIEVGARFDQAGLEFVGAQIAKEFADIFTFLGTPTYNAATGEFFARLALLQAGELATIDEVARLLSVSFIVRDTVPNEARITGEITRVRVNERRPGSPFASVVEAHLVPPDATTTIYTFMRFDINRDGKIDIDDIGDIIFFLYLRQAGSDAWIQWDGWKFDINDDGIIDITDLLYIISYIDNG